jgi:hypothetical protein
MSAPESPAELLRRAAALMLQRAEAVAHGPWHWQALGDHGYPQRVLNAGASLIAECFTSPDAVLVEAEYIASWHPEVTKPIARWLEAAALRAEDNPFGARDLIRGALEVARAYMGESEAEGAGSGALHDQ